MTGKIIFTVFMLFLIGTAVTSAENLYQYDSLDINLKVNGQINLVPENSGSTVKEASAELLLYPKESYRQELINFDPGIGEVKNNKITYQWKNPSTGKKSFGYTAEIQTKDLRNKVKTKINFPIEESLSGYEEYLLPTETIDSNNPEIIAKANELAEGQDDLFKITFNLANWVEENVKYDLNTLTAEASQKASWVLEHREGVCDEMTSLFVAMCRSLGIPARFVSGISYTTSDLFTEKWQPHGWAEVYFPEVGWVSFDTAFGEYGYIDVTHIQLKEEADPAEPSTKFQWLADDVELKSEPLEFKVAVTDYGNKIDEEIQLGIDLLSHEIDFGSYNLVKGHIKNTADYYAVTTLQLAVPKEVQIIGKNKKTILLNPQDSQEIYWILQVPKDLNQNYWYTFPVMIYSEKNISVQEEFKTEKGQAQYSLSEVEQLAVQTEEKSYSQKVSLDCNYPPEIALGEEFKADCLVKNIGNMALKKVNFCLGTACKVIDLAINQKQNFEVVAKTEKAGWNKLLVSAENDLVDKKISLGYLVLDLPKIKMTSEVPSEVVYGQKFQIEFNLEKDSISTPKNIVLTASGFGSENQWKIEELKDKERLVVEFDGQMLSWNNKIELNLDWQDQKGKSYSEIQTLEFSGKSSGFKSSVMMFLNWIMKGFY